MFLENKMICKLDPMWKPMTKLSNVTINEAALNSIVGAYVTAAKHAHETHSIIFQGLSLKREGKQKASVSSNTVILC